MFGRRPDGRRLKHQDPIMQITPYLMPMRCDAQIFLDLKADFEYLTRYIGRKNKDGEKITFMQIIAATYVRAVSNNPEINRFIMNKQTYVRNNCSVSYTILKNPQDTNSDEATVRVLFDLTDTIFDVRDRMDDALEKARKADETNNFVIRLTKGLLSVPGLATLIVWIVRFLDRYGLAPAVLMRELPLYSGMYITNTASIGLPRPFHHIYNFGNVGLFVGIGSVQKETVIDVDGKKSMRRFLPLGITADERICSGAHYAAFLSDVMHYLQNPEELEKPPEQICYDQGIEYHVPKGACEKISVNS